ncbi:MFS transporter [Haloarculaceae archaeon H-GB1-1]|nr:MFS transporter [Haloarculaceae archaeon H-GB1-1]
MGSDTHGAASGAPWRSRTVQVVLASTALAPLGVPLISPALPVFRDTLGISEAQASLLVSGYFVVGIVVSPFLGVLADRVGRKRVLVSGLLTFGLLGGAMAFAPSFEAVLALRVVQGTGAAAIFITTVTIIGDTFTGVQRNTVLGLNVAVLSAAAALFPVLGGALVTVRWTAPFLAYFVAVPVALGAFVAMDEPTRSTPDRGLEYLRDALGVVARPAIVALFTATFLTEFLFFGVVFTAMPFLLARTLSPVAVGVALLVAESAAMLAAAANGRLARRVSNLRLVAVGFACYGVGFLAAWLGPGPTYDAASLAVVGTGVGLLLPSVDAELSDHVPAAYRAGAFSLRNSTTFTGRAAGPITFVGLAVTAGYGYDALLLAAGVVALVAATVAALAPGTLDPAPRV